MFKQKTILVFNAGSTSLKYQIFQEKTLRVLAKKDFSNLNYKKNDHLTVFNKILQEIGDLDLIKIVGHRIVHGGTKFNQSTLLISRTVKEISKFNHLAPLHNPYALKILALAQKYFLKTPHLGVFDTSFFSSLPDKAKIYAIPLKYYQKEGIQRFGFHGISHYYLAEQAAKKLNKKLTEINLITCHLGGGASITAIKNGKAVDTSMGMTPLEGLVMMTRAGDIDPGLIFHLIKENKLSQEKVYDLLNYESGIKGLSNQTNFLNLLTKVKQGEAKSKLALEIFIYRIQKYIGAYFGILGKVDAIVFSGAIGAGDYYTVRKIKKGFKILDQVKILRIKTDEERAIAKECEIFLNKKIFSKN